MSHVIFNQQALRKDEEKAKEMPIFLGYAPSGVVEGEVVYANFGTEKDFRKLKEMGVSVKDKIVIIRQGRVFRGNKVPVIIDLSRILSNAISTETFMTIICPSTRIDITESVMITVLSHWCH